MPSADPTTWKLSAAIDDVRASRGGADLSRNARDLAAATIRRVAWVLKTDHPGGSMVHGRLLEMAKEVEEGGEIGVRGTKRLDKELNHRDAAPGMDEKTGKSE